MLNKRVLSSFVLSIYLVTELNIAFADPFEAGKNTGSSSTNSIYSGITSGGNTSSLPSFGSSSSTNLQSNYPGKGRDDVNSITGLMQQGTSIKNETCSDDDMSCAGRKMVSKKYESSGSNPYKGMAQDMRSDAQNLDPEAILGMNNLPTEGASTVCVEEETTLPPSTEVKTCLDATLQQTTIFTKLPTTVGHEYTSPICIDPMFSISDDLTSCNFEWYSCPAGAQLEGEDCVVEDVIEKELICPAGYVWTDGFCEKEVESLKHMCAPGEEDLGTIYTHVYSSPHKNSVGSGAEQAWTVNQDGEYAIRVYIGSNGLTGYIPIGFYKQGKVISTKSTYSYKTDPRCKPWEEDFGCSTTTALACYPRLNGNGGYGVWMTSTPDEGSGPNACLYGIKNSSRGYDIRLYRVEHRCIEKVKEPIEDIGICPDGTQYQSYNKLVYHSGHANDLNDGMSFMYNVDDPGYYSIKTYIGSNTTSKVYDLGYYDIGDLITTSGDYCIKPGENETYWNPSNWDILEGTGPWGVRVTSKPGPDSCINGVKNGDRGYEIWVYKQVEGCSANKTETYPATYNIEQATPGCLGGPEYSADQLIKSGSEYVDGTESGGLKTCEAEVYSCPAGMGMNGAMCEDVNRMQYESNPNCVNLGYIPEEGAEGFLCITEELRECSTISPDCTQTGEECIWVDQVPGSPTYGQCIASSKTFSCPVDGETITSQNCSFQPMCFNGNCFDQEKKCKPIEGVNPVQVYEEVCQNITKEDIQSCPNNYLLSEPDEDGDKHILEAGPYDYQITYQSGQRIVNRIPLSSCEWHDKPNCTLVPATMETDDEGNAMWPTDTYFSCIGDTLELCNEDPYGKPGLDHDEECTLKSTAIEQYSIDGGTPVVTSKKFSCERQLTVPTDECTQDFALMAVSMEASREAGTYLNEDSLKIFGGETHFCDRKSVSWGGSNLGSKSCCNISAPDPQNDSDIMSDIKQSVALDATLELVEYAWDTGSTYVYNFMMQSETFQQVAGYVSAASTASSTATAAESASSAANLSSASYGVSYAGVGISYGMSSMIGTSSFPIGGSGMYLTFNPYMFGIVVATKLYESYQAALACEEKDYKTATLTKGKLCYEYGSWCEKKVSGMFGSTCQKYRTGKCCYNSKLARIINYQGRQQLGLPMDDCNGFTVDQINQLNWSEIDLSEFISDMLDKAKEGIPSEADLNALNTKLINNISSSASTGVQPIDQGYEGGQKSHH